ncbi:hypothetical protein [Kitasatospora albolonga]|uniref:hypothetical protein n=1 Tax=Kitasatospora albolonga TaxID=68173 RepID=UPI0031ED0385
MRIARRRNPAVAPHPDYMQTPLDLLNGLKVHRRECGDPSLRQMERNARETGFHLPRSTSYRLLAGMPPDWKQVEAFLIACRPRREPDLAAWRHAWQRIFSRPIAADQRVETDSMIELMARAIRLKGRHSQLTRRDFDELYLMVRTLDRRALPSYLNNWAIRVSRTAPVSVRASEVGLQRIPPESERPKVDLRSEPKTLEQGHALLADALRQLVAKVEAGSGDLGGAPGVGYWPYQAG